MNHLSMIRFQSCVLFRACEINLYALSVKPVPTVVLRRNLVFSTLESLGTLKNQRKTLLQPIAFVDQSVRGKTKKGKSKVKSSKTQIDDLLDELSDDEDDDSVIEEGTAFKDTDLSNFLKQRSPGKKPTKGSVPVMKYQEFMAVTRGEHLWKELEEAVEKLKNVYMHQLNVRSSTSLDELPVNLEGDSYPLNELATISKKDPKKLIIDSSAFPQAAPNIMASIRASGMNLNPQQDGLRIFVPIPKVTKEFREKLAAGARFKLNEFKNEARAIQNKYVKVLNESELMDEVSKDDSKAASSLIKVITDDFLSRGDQLHMAKTKDILGK